VVEVRPKPVFAGLPKKAVPPSGSGKLDAVRYGDREINGVPTRFLIAPEHGRSRLRAGAQPVRG
jgi:hypothetical protein